MINTISRSTFCCCVACSSSSVAETRDRALGFVQGSGIHEVVLKVTRGGFEQTTPVLLVRLLNHYATAPVQDQPSGWVKCSVYFASWVRLFSWDTNRNDHATYFFNKASPPSPTKSFDFLVFLLQFRGYLGGMPVSKADNSNGTSENLYQYALQCMVLRLR